MTQPRRPYGPPAIGVPPRRPARTRRRPRPRYAEAERACLAALARILGPAR